MTIRSDLGRPSPPSAEPWFGGRAEMGDGEPTDEWVLSTLELLLDDLERTLGQLAELVIGADPQPPAGRDRAGIKSLRARP